MTKSPEFGQLELVGRTAPAQAFTQDDVEKNQLMYKHTSTLKSLEDRFLFQVYANGILVEEEFRIRLFPEVYLEPLVLENNRTVLVEEGTEITITHEDLLVGALDFRNSNCILCLRESSRQLILITFRFGKLEYHRQTSLIL